MRKSTFIFIILSGIASFFNYATYPALARILSDAQFVNITVALAIFTQLSSFTLSIVALTIGLSKQRNDHDSTTTIEKLQTVLIHLFVALLAIFLISSPLFFSKLAIPVSLLLPISIMLSLSIITSVVSGYLNGRGKLVKLGIALVLIAVVQFVLSVSSGILTKNGTVTLYAMSAGTILSLAFIYLAYKDEGLPKIASILTHKFSIYKSHKLRALLKFIILASLATLAINILLILDLLIINSRGTDAKQYSDIYVVSRVVFFGGMLFVWPFLSNVNIYKLKKNTLLLVKLCGLFTGITLAAIIIIQIFGQQIFELLFGPEYRSMSGTKELALLAIVYKYIFLIMTALVLYFIVIRSYWAMSLSLIATLSMGVYVLVAGSNISSVLLVRGLNITSAAVLLLGLYGFVLTSRKKQSVDPSQ